MSMNRVADNQFDHQKFRARYGLSERDYRVNVIEGQLFVELFVSIPDAPPIFDAPNPAKAAEVAPPLRLTPGTPVKAPITLTAGRLLTHPEAGALEYTDDGNTGHLYFTLNVNGLPKRIQLI